MNGKWPATLTAETLEQLSDEEFWHYAHELALQAPTETPPVEYLKCELGCGDYFIPLAALYEVVPSPHQFALLPSMPTWMPGVFAWHGETIAVVDLDAYLLANVSQLANDPARSSGYSLINEAPVWTLLVVKHSGLAVGLLVPTSSLTMTAGKSDHEQAEAFELDLPKVLTELVQQIRDGCLP